MEPRGGTSRKEKSKRKHLRVPAVYFLQLNRTVTAPSVSLQVTTLNGQHDAVGTSDQSMFGFARLSHNAVQPRVAGQVDAVGIVQHVIGVVVFGSGGTVVEGCVVGVLWVCCECIVSVV